MHSIRFELLALQKELKVVYWYILFKKLVMGSNVEQNPGITYFMNAYSIPQICPKSRYHHRKYTDFAIGLT